MEVYDEKVLQAFLDGQARLFPKPVARTLKEAEDFLTECMAVVVNSAEEVAAFFDEEGIDIEELSAEGSLLEAEEVFAVGDGRYLIVEG